MKDSAALLRRVVPQQQTRTARRLVSAVAFAVMPAIALRAGAQATIASGDSVQRGDSTSSRMAAAARPDSNSRYQVESFSSFARRSFGPVPLLRSAALAGFDQWRRQPVHWTQTSRGFRDRLDARLGGEVLGHGIRYAIDRVAEEQSGKYRSCQCEGLEARAAHALFTPFRVETPHGERYSVMTPTGVIISSLAVTSVHPGGFSLSRGLASGAGSIGSTALSSLVREFWPWHWRPPGL